MSDTTFEELYKGLKVYAPDTPLPLCKQYINEAYSEALSGNRWSGLREDDEFVINTPYEDGTITVTQGSATVTGSSTAFTSAMAGRQLIVESSAPFYDISSVESGTSLTLTRPYSGSDDSGASYSIENVYLDCPSDFLKFIIAVDIENDWKLHLHFLQEQIDVWDADRSSTGTPWLLVPTSTRTASSGEVRRYELWPRASAAKTIPFRYYKKPSLLSSTSDTTIFPIRGDIVREGALAKLALWPGTKENPNPYYSIDLHRVHKKNYEYKLGLAEVEDQEIALTWLRYDGAEGLPWAPIDAKYIQTHDVL